MLSPRQHPGKQSLNTLLTLGGQMSAKINGEQKKKAWRTYLKKPSLATYLNKLQAEANLQRAIIDA